MPSNIIYRPVFIQTDGQLHSLADGSIINAGGTSSSTFTVGGVPVATASDFTLQGIYNNSSDASGGASIKLTTGKDFTILDDTDDGLFFKVDAETGAVTITGDLTVLGNTTTVESNVINADHWVISPGQNDVVGFLLEPDSGNIPLVDIFKVKAAYGATDSITVTQSGTVVIRNLNVQSDMVISGTINNVDVVATSVSLSQHVSYSATAKHTAQEISVPVGSIPHAMSATNVQAALQQLGNAINGGTGSGYVIGYAHEQSTASAIWTVTHNKETTNATYTLFDGGGMQVLPDNFIVIDANTVEVRFNVPQAGRLILNLF